MKPITIIAINIITILNYGISGVEVAQRMFMVSVLGVFFAATSLDTGLACLLTVILQAYAKGEVCAR